MENKITSVIKRDGTIVPFDREKVIVAIYKAAAAVGGHNRRLSEKLADESIDMLNQCFQPPDWPSVEEVQDIVEKVLIENGHAKTAKSYIVYREGRRLERERKAASRGRESPLPYRIMYQTLLWNMDHGCETIAKLNERLRDGSFPELIREADQAYSESIDLAAESIAEVRDQVRLIIVAGPSSSGKTTTTAKLALKLHELGVETVLLNLDHYFFDLELHPRDEHGDYDFETPEALDLSLIDSHLKALIEGQTVKMPTYDFVKGKRLEGTKEISIKPHQKILIDTLHGLYKPMTKSLPDEMKFKVYIETISELRDSRGEFMRWTDVRLLRRIVRDHAQRGYDPAQTIGHWHYVRRSELKHIIPFIRDADYIVNGALPYEMPFHRKYSFDHFPNFIACWKDDPRRQEACIRADRIQKLLSEIDPCDDDSMVPPDSLLREFIGGSAYKLH